MEPQQIYVEIRKNMEELFGDKLKKIILYGSYARNKQDDDSDIDFFVIVDETEQNLQKKKYRVADIMAELTLSYDILVSITESTYKHYQDFSNLIPFYKNIQKEGIVIYGQ